MFRAYVPLEDAPEKTASVIVHGRWMVCLAECDTLEELKDEIAEAWHSLGEIIITDPVGRLVIRR